MNKQKTITLISAIIIILIIVVAWKSFGAPEEQEVSMDEPVDIAVDFYRQWLDEMQSPETDLYESELAKSPLLSKELRNKIKDAKGYGEDEVDPVLCQSTADIEISTRRILERDDEVRILVTAKDKSLTGQSLMTLLAYNDGWYINDITCSPGEFEEEREFSFEKEGFVLKGSMLEDANPDMWHIIFEENGDPGYSAPLMFDGESNCPDQDIAGGVCAPEQFEEVTKVFIQGQMTERGVEVKQLEFRKK